MSHVAVLLLALVAALAQVAVLPVLTPDLLTAPLVPVALLGAWCAVRNPVETWPVLLITPLLVAPLSEERLGWFLIALLPAALLGTLLSPIETRGGPPSPVRRIGVAAVVAGGGTVAHAAILATAGGVPGRLAEDAVSLAGAATWTMLFAVLLALALLPLRARSRGLFA